MNVELEGTDGVGDLFNRVALPVGKVVHGVNAPFIACTMVWHVEDAIENRVAEEHIRVCHIYFSTHHLAAVGELAVLHPFQKVKIFFGGTVAPWAICTRSCYRSTVRTDFFLCLVVNVS